MQKRVRTSGLKRKNKNKEKENCIEENNDSPVSYDDFKNDYSFLIEANRKRNLGKAYIVTSTKNPKLFFIAFAMTKDKAKVQGNRYFYETEWQFSNDLWDNYLTVRAHRHTELDVYAEAKKVPIDVIMKMGYSFRCGVCGKTKFTYKDVEIGKCFIVEDEGDMNPYTKGMVVCYNCYKKYFN